MYSNEARDAIRRMQEALARPDNPQEMRITAQIDQIRAGLRDMGAEEREFLARHVAESEEDMSVEDARQWIREMLREE